MFMGRLESGESRYVLLRNIWTFSRGLVERREMLRPVNG